MIPPRCFAFGVRFVVLSVLLFGGSLSLLASDDAGTTFHVSPEGNEGWSGRFEMPNAERTDGPFATLERARDAVKGPKVKPVTVLVRGGVYTLKRTVAFTAEHGGTAAAPVTFD